MRREVNPQDTSRAQAFALWMKSPVPMVTLTKTFDVTRIYKMCRRRKLKFNMLLCWCIGRAASQMKEFYLLPEGEKMYLYDRLAINVIVSDIGGGISNCDVPYSDSLEQFCRDYDDLTDREQDELFESPDDDVRILVGEIQEKIEHLTESIANFLAAYPNDLKRANRLNETLYDLTEELDEEIEELSSWGA